MPSSRTSVEGTTSWLPKSWRPARPGLGAGSTSDATRGTRVKEQQHAGVSLRHVPALVSPKAGLEASLPTAPGCVPRPRPAAAIQLYRTTRFTKSLLDRLVWTVQVGVVVVSSLPVPGCLGEGNRHVEPTSRVEGHRRVRGPGHGPGLRPGRPGAGGTGRYQQRAPRGQRAAG